MNKLVVRRLLIDLEAPLAKRWNGGDAFSTALFNALSMSFPVGEQYFIDSVRAGLKALPEAERERLAGEVQGFIGQEATHRRLHALFNAHLETQGLRNELEQRARRRIEANAAQDPRIHVGATAATEHLTAVFANWLQRHPEALAGAQERLQTLWLWHAAEESEHRSTAFDIYVAMGGNYQWRVRLLNYVTITFFADLLRQTVRNLWHDGSLFRPSTWGSAWRMFFGEDGLIRGNLATWRDYKSPDFHPTDHDATRSAQWLRDHADAFAVVGQGR